MNFDGFEVTGRYYQECYAIIWFIDVNYDL